MILRYMNPIKDFFKNINCSRKILDERSKIKYMYIYQWIRVLHGVRGIYVYRKTFLYIHHHWICNFSIPIL